MRSIRLVAVPAAILAAVLGWTPAASAETTSVVAADLSGANEVPPTDAALVGDSFAALDTESGEICYRVSANVGPATGLHIHRGWPAGTGRWSFPSIPPS